MPTCLGWRSSSITSRLPWRCLAVCRRWPWPSRSRQLCWWWVDHFSSLSFQVWRARRVLLNIEPLKFASFNGLSLSVCLFWNELFRLWHQDEHSVSRFCEEETCFKTSDKDGNMGRLRDVLPWRRNCNHQNYVLCVYLSAYLPSIPPHRPILCVSLSLISWYHICPCCPNFIFSLFILCFHISSSWTHAVFQTAIARQLLSSRHLTRSFIGVLSSD